MNCRDFERIWNELIDVRSQSPGDDHARAAADRESSLFQHAATCAACRRSAAGYEVLHQAILAWGNAPEPPRGLTDRVLAAVEAPPRASRATARLSHPSISNRWWIAAAASILALLTFGVIFSRMNVNVARDRGRLAQGVPVPAPDSGGNPSESAGLNDALASASEATWDLALSASEPAARLSRQFLDAAGEPDIPRNSGSSAAVSVPSLDSITPDSASAVETIQQVGDRLASGVRPLSSSARQAFGFLLGPPPPKPDVRANPPAARGA
jgi:hypothetical protein